MPQELRRYKWFHNPNVYALIGHMIDLAAFKDHEWEGIELKAGQFVGGRKMLAGETGLTEQEVRTALGILKKSKLLTIKSTNKYSIYTLTKWRVWQEEDYKTNQQINQHTDSTDEQPANQPAFQPTVNRQINQQDNGSMPNESRVLNKHEGITNQQKRQRPTNKTADDQPLQYIGNIREDWNTGQERVPKSKRKPTKRQEQQAAEALGEIARNKDKPLPF